MDHSRCDIVERLFAVGIIVEPKILQGRGGGEGRLDGEAPETIVQYY